MTALDFAVAAVILVPMSFIIAVCVDEIRKAYRRHRGEKRIDAHAAKRRSKFRIKRRPVTEWKVWDEELPAELSATEREMQAKGREVLRWPGRCSHGDTYDHGPVLPERSFGRKSEDGSLEEPSVVVFHLDAEEWAAARDKALADLGCTWPDLAVMAADRDFPTSEHGKVWGALGGWSEYERWASEDDADAEVTATPKGEYL